MARSHSYTPPMPGAVVRLTMVAQREYLDRFGWYTFAVQRDDRRWTAGTIALVLEEDVVVELGSLSPASGGATGQRKLRYERGFEIAPVAATEIKRALPKPQLRATFGDRVEWGGRLPPKTWTAVVEALRQLRPEYRPALDDLFAEFGGRTTGLGGQPLQVAAHERDAVGLALDFADFDRAILREALPDGQGSFVQRLGGSARSRIR